MGIDEQTLLLELRKHYPTIESTVAVIAQLRAQLSLPKSTTHVISDVHGEFKKLKHVINNASGSLRPLVEKTFAMSLSERERLRLLSFIYYPAETFSELTQRNVTPSDDEIAELVRVTARQQIDLLSQILPGQPFGEIDRVLPDSYRMLLWELITAPRLNKGGQFMDEVIRSFTAQKKGLELVRTLSRLIRNLSVSELIVAGDLGDRGPRIDRVIDVLMHQPRVRITWGNHDASWLGACLGHEACIATVVRISLRYGCLPQLEEGYGIPMLALERLARTVYGADDAQAFACRGEGLRDARLMAQMQKAIAIILFKLEGELIHRNPQFELEHRALLHRISADRATVEIDGKSYPMKDTFLPTLDPQNPYQLTAEERECIEHLRHAFIESAILWQHMKYVLNKGRFYMARDNHLIFHACVPAQADGTFQALHVDGKECAGKELFDRLNSVVHRAFSERRGADLDMLWYLWSGPLSPWFGKDKMATFENYFVEAAETHREEKNSYFALIHEAWFCRKVLSEFGITDPQGLIVNGHVPVKIEKGESPMKRSGLAVTIDGAFSEAYGDHGYTLVLDANGTRLAQHHHFGSVSEAIVTGADIIPAVESIRTFDHPRTVGDTERGAEIRRRIALLERLAEAYHLNLVPEIESRGS